ncbi:MAG: UxaA family hydrolase [Desulfarculaceae bacterium]|jgi:altronate dehydratase
MQASSHKKHRAIQIHADDNVATATEAIPAGGQALVLDKTGNSRAVTVLEPIPAFHKFAVKEIKTGDQVIKYGYSIGQITQDAMTGAWVHVHNIKSLRGRKLRN